MEDFFVQECCVHGTDLENHGPTSILCDDPLPIESNDYKPSFEAIVARVQVEEVRVHTNKHGVPSRVDIALVRVKAAIDLATHTPLCLPQPDLQVRGRNVTLAGGGSECAIEPETKVQSKVRNHRRGLLGSSPG